MVFQTLSFGTSIISIHHIIWYTLRAKNKSSLRTKLTLRRRRRRWAHPVRLSTRSRDTFGGVRTSYWYYYVFTTSYNIKRNLVCCEFRARVFDFDTMTAGYYNYCAALTCVIKRISADTARRVIFLRDVFVTTARVYTYAGVVTPGVCTEIMTEECL